MAEEFTLIRHEERAAGSKAELVVRASDRMPYTVSPFLYGKFCEHLGRNIYHGMEAQILWNPTFGKWRFAAGDGAIDGGVLEQADAEKIERSVRGVAARQGWPDAGPLLEAYRDGCAFGWFRLGARDDVRVSPDVGPHGQRAQRVEAPGASGGAPVGLGQWIHLPLHRTRDFEYRVVARAFAPTTVELSLAPVDAGGRAGPTVARAGIEVDREWRTLTGRLSIPAGVKADGLFLFAARVSSPAHLVLDRVLLYPDDHVGGACPDVIRMLREARLPLLRWPGGNFVSGYRWRDGVGPVDARPTVPNPAWEGLEFNLFGTPEFIAFCRAVGCEPLICVNAGDGTPEEAGAWVEYCNGTPDTPMGRWRAEHGYPQPFGVRYWEIGNELYGRWQVGWTTPEGNLDRYLRFREAMRRAAPTIRTIGCGKGNEPDSEWNRRLAAGAGARLRAITDHILTGGSVDAQTDPVELYHAFMGQAEELERRYRILRERMRESGAEDPHLAITELQLFARFRGETRADGKLSPETMPTPATISEALYHATIVHACIRLGGFVELLTHSATVNHGGGLRKARERVWANPVHYGHQMGMALAGGTPVSVRLACGTFSTRRAFASIPPRKAIPVLDAMAVRAGGGEALVLTIVHRGATCGPVELSIVLEDFRARGEAEVVTLAGESWHDRNTLEAPERIRPRRASASVKDDGRRLDLTLPPFSLTRVTFPGA